MRGLWHGAVSARAPEEGLRGLRSHFEKGRACFSQTAETNIFLMAPEGPMRGLRHGAVRARAPEEQVLGLRHGPMRARAPEEQMRGLRHGAVSARTPEEGLRGLRSCLLRFRHHLPRYGPSGIITSRRSLDWESQLVCQGC
jgi:hypothetical protein